MWSPPPVPPTPDDPDFQNEIDAQIDSLIGRGEESLQFCRSTAELSTSILNETPVDQAKIVITGSDLLDHNISGTDRGMAAAGPALYISGRVVRCCKSLCVYAKVKRFRLPGVQKVTINMPHIMERHTVGKPAITVDNNTLYPSWMSEANMEKAILEAYKKGKILKTQGDRVKVQGNGVGKPIWF